MLSEIPARIRELEQDNTALRAVSVERIPTFGGEHNREDAEINNITLREQLAWQWESARLWVQIVDSGLSVLTCEQRQILDRFYIHPEKGAVDRLCEELFLERNSVYRRRDEALRYFTIALYGTE